jgi:hypothetical protein
VLPNFSTGRRPWLLFTWHVFECRTIPRTGVRGIVLPGQGSQSGRDVLGIDGRGFHNDIVPGAPGVGLAADVVVFEGGEGALLEPRSPDRRGGGGNVRFAACSHSGLSRTARGRFGLRGCGTGLEGVVRPARLGRDASPYPAGCPWREAIPQVVASLRATTLPRRDSAPLGAATPRVVDQRERTIANSGFAD